MQRTYDLFINNKNVLSNCELKDNFTIDSLNEFEKSVYKKVNQTIKKYET